MTEEMEDAPERDEYLGTRPELFERYWAQQSATEGWFSRGAAAVFDCLLGLQSRLDVSGNTLEIGVWQGRSAALIALHTRPAGEGCVLVDKFMQREVLDSTLARSGLKVGGSLSLLPVDSRILHNRPLARTGFHSFRWIHIDGEHTARTLTSDLELAHRLLSDKGVVAIDDFFSFMYPQLTEAVFRFLRERPYDFTLFLGGYNKAYLARPFFATRYRQYCHRDLMDELEARGVQATLHKTTIPSEMDCYGLTPRRPDGVRFRGPDWDQRPPGYSG